MKTKAIIMAILSLATLCGAGLLRLHEGQIQEEQPDGTWQCVDQEIREIVNREPNEIFNSDITFNFDDETILTLNFNEDTNRVEAIYDANQLDEAAQLFMEYVVGRYLGICVIDDSNEVSLMSAPMIRQLCESGRVCEVMGHQWQVDWHGILTDGGGEKICGLCGKHKTYQYVETLVERNEQ